jgi:hypothetical protein
MGQVGPQTILYIMAKKEDGRKNNGGARKGAGRKPMKGREKVGYLTLRVRKSKIPLIKKIVGELKDNNYEVSETESHKI